MPTRTVRQLAAFAMLVGAPMLGFVAMHPARAALVPGGGRSASDCFGEFDLRGADGSRRIVCVDGNPECDVDRLCQGICTFEAAVCLNQANVEGCAAQPLKRPAVVDPALPVPTPDGAEAICGPATSLEVQLRGRRRNKPRTVKLRLTVVTTGTPSKDRDIVILRCEPHPAGACSSTTTTTSTASLTSTSSPTSTAGSTSTSSPTTTTLLTVTLCEEDNDCPQGVWCSQGVCCNRPCAEPCSVCSIATGGICTPLSCRVPGECERGPGTCDPERGACDYPKATDGVACGGEGSGRICCNGSCCEPGEDCAAGTCQPVCSGLGAACASEEECCQDGATLCEGSCCHDVASPCTTDAECCSGQCRKGGTCCAPPGAPCVSEGDCCTGGLGDCTLTATGRVCRCLQPGQPCRSSQECCGLDVCVNGTCRTGSCQPPQSSCRSSFECCWDGTTVCDPLAGGAFACCRGNGARCGTSSDCCAGETCGSGRCCRPAGSSCTSATLCCAGLTCREGACLPSCPVGSFPCGPTCCGSFEFCVAGKCQCVPLQGNCDPNNNLCCQHGETLCPAQNGFGNANTCCRPQGGQCRSAADCCDERYDVQWHRDTCGADGVCGGNGAYCAKDADCVDGRVCIGLCSGKGQGFTLCASSEECPSGQLCSQRRCIDRDAVPR